MVFQEKIVTSLKNQREKWINDFSEDGFIGHTHFLEISLISLYNRLMNLLNVDAEQFRANGVVLALGDFGRGFIGPYQRVPILFLKTDTCKLQDDWLREIINPLEEAGWKIDYEVLTDTEVIKRVDRDCQFLQEVASARYLSGNRSLLDKLELKLYEWFEANREFYIQNFRAKWSDPSRFQLGPEPWLEPDIIDFPGGLGDLRNLRAALAVLGCTTLDDAITSGLLFREDADELRKIEKFYLRIMNVLFARNSHSCKLEYGLQEEVAKLFGYAPRMGFSEVENFMRDLYVSFQAVRRALTIFWGLVRSEKERSLDERELEKGILLASGELRVNFDEYNLLDPASFVKIFRIAADHKATVSAETLRHLRACRNVLETSAGDRAVLIEFMAMMESDSNDVRTLRLFHDMELLSSIIPEWKGIVGLVQHDLFHAYPFDEHALRTVAEVKKVLNGHYDSEERELTVVASRISYPGLLYLAALLHDIGKSGGSGHAIKGGEMIPTISQRLGLLPVESDFIQFLVANHTLLMDSASMRDVGDEEMLANCALSVGDLVKLDHLLVMTFADLKATGPRAFQKWEQSPIIFLHERLSRILEKGEPSPALIAERLEQMKMVVQQRVSDLMDESEVASQLAEVDPRYLLSMEPAEIAQHLRMEWDLFHGDEPVVWEVRRQERGWVVTIVSEMLPWLLFKAAGLMTLHDIDIVAAQIFLKKNNVVVLIFNCMSRNLGKEPDWNEVREELIKLLEHKFALDYRLSKHFREARQVGPVERNGRESRIVVDNDSSEAFTILEVYTYDRPGLLYTITKTLADFGIRVYVAKISTRGDQVADVFYVRDHLGRKLTDSELIEELKNAVKYWLDECEYWH
ncbi:MAG: hypothetical protein JRI31_01270 [Deltaproteobacteria bacterium]|nr:hypothetical protein [Deltaproteobacteria bacterium]